jgi:hypothetical protein
MGEGSGLQQIWSVRFCFSSVVSGEFQLADVYRKEQ